MAKRILMVLLAVTVLCLVGAAYSVPDHTIVYVTPTGEKYHREDCSYTTTVRALSIKDAEQKGYTPCSRCDPDVLQGKYTPKGGKNSASSGSSNRNGTGSKQETKDSASEALYMFFLGGVFVMFLMDSGPKGRQR